MTDFNYLKQENVTATAQVTHKDHSKQNMYSVLYSYDKNISKLVIPVIVAGDQVLDFETIKRVRILLTFIHEGLQKSIEDIGVIESPENKTLSYIVTDKLKGFVGQITMNIYLDLTTDQQIDLAEYGFSMKRSLIDQNIPEIEQFYFKSLDDVIVELQEKSKTILDKVAADSSAAVKKIEDIEKQIAQQKIVKEDDFKKYQTSISNTAQLTKITADNGNHLKSFNSGSILDILIAYGSGFRTFLAYGEVTDLPELGVGFRFFVNSGQGGFGSVLGSTDKAKIYFRHFAANKWVGEWQRLVSENEVQLSKVTADNGTAYLNVTDNETILDRVLKDGAGFKTGLAGAKVSDSPSNTSAMRFLSNMVAATGGSVLAQDAAGNVWSRIISSSKWHTDWQRLAPASEAQLSKVTADDGTVFLKVADTETIISTIVAAGAGIRTGTASAKVSDNPTSTNLIMFVANMVTSSGGYVIGTNTAGITWTRAITSKRWSGGWQQLTSTSQAQISKITADDGGVYQGISSGSILSVVLANKRGLRNYHAYGAVTDLPSNSVYRFIANMTSDTHGNVSGMDDLGNYYARAIVNSVWVGEWRKI